MKSEYIKYWKNSLGNPNDNSGKLYLYRRIKGNFKIEPYLKQVNKNKIRRAMTALRISSHSLEIERGRYANKKGGPIDRKNRFCTLCRKQGFDNLGDEEHALMVCPTFELERKEVIENISNTHPSFLRLNNYDKMVFMLKCEGECASYATKFIFNILSTP